MSAQFGAPGLGRAQLATPAYSTAPQGSSVLTASHPARVTRRAIAVAAATLGAPLMTAAALGAIGAAAGGNHAELGTLAGTQGLRGTTVSAGTPAPPQNSGPAAEASRYGKGDSRLSEGEPGPTVTHPAQGQPQGGSGTRAPAPNAPSHAAPKPSPTPKGGLKPPTRAPSPTYDPTAPGAPTSPGTTGGTNTPGSTSGSSGTNTANSSDGYYGGG
jgi:hypothetical protein